MPGAENGKVKRRPSWRKAVRNDVKEDDEGIGAPMLVQVSTRSVRDPLPTLIFPLFVVPLLVAQSACHGLVQGIASGLD